MNYTDEVKKIIQKYDLNEELLETQQVQEDNILQMPKYYDDLKTLFNEANEKVTDEVADKIGKELEYIESKLQKLWNFKSNTDYFTYWNKLQGCKCPKQDNKESYGNCRIINCECPYHKHLCTREGYIN